LYDRPLYICLIVYYLLFVYNFCAAYMANKVVYITQTHTQIKCSYKSSQIVRYKKLSI